MIAAGAAVMLGLAGSLHCVGMCGPLALVLPRREGSRGAFVAGRLLYNLGRALTYSAMGAVFGLFGQSLLLAGWQNGLSLAVGILILIYLATRCLGAGRWSLESALLRFVAPVQRRLAARLVRPGAGSLFVIGLLNGLLPCGLVYVALAAAAATGSAVEGLLFMLVFGLGTAPLMLAVSLAGPSLHASLRGRMQSLVPVALCTLAALFILRGLSLGIPYLSPDLPAQVEHGAPPACCPAGSHD